MSDVWQSFSIDYERSGLGQHGICNLLSSRKFNMPWSVEKLKRNFGDWPRSRKPGWRRFLKLQSRIFHLSLVLWFFDLLFVVFWGHEKRKEISRPASVGQWERKIFIFEEIFFRCFALLIMLANHKSFTWNVEVKKNDFREKKIFYFFFFWKPFFHYFYSCRVLFIRGWLEVWRLVFYI